MKYLNKRIIIAVIAVIISIIVIIITAFGDKIIKLEYEINLRKVATDVDYSTIKTEQGIQCGSIKIVLGQKIDITAYTVTKELEKDGIVLKQLLAPSKKYELVVVGANDTWYVQEIRTTVPEVYSLQGYTVGDTRKDVKKCTTLSGKKKVTITPDDCTETRLEFISDILVVIDMRCL